MSVPVSKHTESKFEVLVYSSEIHSMLREFMQRNFGVKDMKHLVQMRYAYGKDDTEDFQKYYYLLATHKKNIDQLATAMTNNIRGANSLHPTTLHECDVRRDYQNAAIINCEQIKKDLMKAVETFNVDLNAYKPYIQAIDREIGLIKKWRQKDNKIRSYIKGSI